MNPNARARAAAAARAAPLRSPVPSPLALPFFSTQIVRPIPAWPGGAAPRRRVACRPLRPFLSSTRPRPPICGHQPESIDCTTPRKGLPYVCKTQPPNSRAPGCERRQRHACSSRGGCQPPQNQKEGRGRGARGHAAPCERGRSLSGRSPRPPPPARRPVRPELLPNLGQPLLHLRRPRQLLQLRQLSVQLGLAGYGGARAAGMPPWSQGGAPAAKQQWGTRRRNPRTRRACSMLALRRPHGRNGRSACKNSGYRLIYSMVSPSKARAE